MNTASATVMIERNVYVIFIDDLFRKNVRDVMLIFEAGHHSCGKCRGDLGGPIREQSCVTSRSMCVSILIQL